MEYFVSERSIVRQIWGKSDTILLIFAGAAAEFALNKAVDWLYFTGRLPSDPLGRLFTTVSYARAIVFAEERAALRAINGMNLIHAMVEAKRGAKIPDWAYRDVLFMLIDYSIRSFELLERKLSPDEKREVFNVFQKLGGHMQITGLPETFEEWITMRAKHIHEDLQHTDLTDDLFRQYRKHLGAIRYGILVEMQAILVPLEVRDLLGYRAPSIMALLMPLYKLVRYLRLDGVLKALILPDRYKEEIKGLDHSHFAIPIELRSIH